MLTVGFFMVMNIGKSPLTKAIAIYIYDLIALFFALNRIFFFCFPYKMRCKSVCGSAFLTDRLLHQCNISTDQTPVWRRLDWWFQNGCNKWTLCRVILVWNDICDFRPNRSPLSSITIFYTISHLLWLRKPRTRARLFTLQSNSRMGHVR